MIPGINNQRAQTLYQTNKQSIFSNLNLQSMFTPEVPKHPACLSIWLESLFEHIDYRVTVVKNDPRNRKKEKNGAPQNWFFSASMSLHLFEWLSLSSSQYYILKGLQSKTSSKNCSKRYPKSCLKNCPKNCQKIGSFQHQ